MIDLRDDEGWANGNIPGARRAGDDLEAEVESIDSDRRLLIGCEDGSRSGMAPSQPIRARPRRTSADAE